MALLSWPSSDDFKPSSSEWQIQSSTGIVVSPMTKTEVLLDLPGARWIATLTFEDMDPDDWKDLDGLLANLSPGLGNTVLLPDSAYAAPRGNATSGSASGNAGSYAVNVASVNGSAPQIMRGDRMQIANRLYVVRSQPTLSGGAATVSIFPPLYGTIAGSAITFLEPKCTMRLTDDNQNRVSHETMDYGSRVIQFTEPRP